MLTSPRHVGFLFLAAIFAYATGNGLVESVLHGPDSTARLATHPTHLGSGALLMLLNSLIVVAIGVAMLPVLKVHSEWVGYAYLTARVVEAVMLTVGVAFLLSLTAVAQGTSTGETQAIPALMMKAQFFAYQTAMAALGLGSIPFCHLLYQSQLVPGALAMWGLIGYLIFLAGALLEIYGYKGVKDVGLMLSIPGGLFEIAFGVWLLVKGFGQDSKRKRQ